MESKSDAEKEKSENLLGVSTDELAGLTVEELVGNKTAITMLLHYYKMLVDENSALKNDNNTLRTYEEGYGRKKTFSGIGAALLAVSAIFIGFGVNFITGGQGAVERVGIVSLFMGVVLIGVGLYLSFRE